MKKVAIYIIALVVLLITELTGLTNFKESTIFVITLCCLLLPVGFVVYGFLKAASDHRKTRKFWELYRKDHEELNQEEE